MLTLLEALNTAKDKFDLTNPSHQKSLTQLTENLLLMPQISPESLIEAALKNDAPLEFKIAVKLALSRRFVQSQTRALKIAVIFAMWGEQNRLLPKSKENPNGEDALRIKINQLNWICAGSEIKWHLYAVDDGCPHGSAALAQKIMATHPEQKNVTVLHLSEAIPVENGPLKNLKDVNDSRKGGAVIYGCMQALKDGVDAVIYTDADNSVHLGQIGLLLKPYIEGKSKVVLGNRKDKQAVLVKQENRWGIGIKVLRHMQRMIGDAIFSRGILDTQAAFKLYDATLLKEIIKEPTVYDFSFDTDWILATIAMEEPFEKVPFAFVDSFAESASIVQGPMSTWLTLLKGLTAAVRRHNLKHNKTMARVLDEEINSAKDLDALIDHLPQELVDIKDSALGNPDILSPEKLQIWIKERKIEFFKK